MKRRPKYRPSPDMALKAMSIKNHRDMFAVVFEDAVLLKRRSNYRSSPLYGVKHAVFLAKENADIIINWAQQNSANVYAVTGDKAIFYDREDAILCMLAFS